MSKRTATLVSTAGALIFAMAAPAYATVTFDSANVHSNALSSSTDGASANGYGNGANADVVTSFTPAIDASSYADAVSVSHGLPVAEGKAIEDASATFATAAAGTIEFSGNIFNTVSTLNGEAQGQDDGQYYNYTFDVDAASTFNLTYAFAETYAGVNNSYILIDNTSGTVVGQLNANGNISGSNSFDLAAGNYILGASTEVGDFAYQSGIGSSTGSHDEKFAFNIASVSAAPEPGMWALMFAGVAMIGGMLRFANVRRREEMASVAA